MKKILEKSRCCPLNYFTVVMHRILGRIIQPFLKSGILAGYRIHKIAGYPANLDRYDKI
jgi:hypothetical protein